VQRSVAKRRKNSKSLGLYFSYGGFRRRFLLLFLKKEEWGISVVFVSFSEKEDSLREGVVRFINKLHLSLYIHKWVGGYGKKDSIIKR